MPKRDTIASLKKEMAELKNNADFALNNSLSALVQDAGIQSNLTSFNTIIQNNLYAPLTLNWTLLLYMYKTHGLMQTAVDMPVLDAMRGGIDISSGELSPEDVKQIQDDLENYNMLGTICEAMQWSRLFGGGGIIINTDQDPSTPLKEKQFKKLELYACSRWELMSVWKPNAGAFSTPWEAAAHKESEYFWFYGKRFHKSRIVTLSGKTAPYILRWQLQGWGMSEYERIIPDFNSYLKTKEVTYELLEEAKVDVYRLKDLNAQLISKVGTDRVKTRVQLMNEQKNFNRAIVMDMTDEYEQKQMTFSGLAEVMKQNQVGIASALRYPMTKLFGLSAAGFNSGEDDIENYNALVESDVRQPMRPCIRKVLNLLMYFRFGFVPDFSFEYKPLRVLGAVEEEAVKTSKQNRHVGLYDRSLISSEELGQVLQKEKLLPIETNMEKGLLDEHPVGPEQEMEAAASEKAGGENE